VSVVSADITISGKLFDPYIYNSGCKRKFS